MTSNISSQAREWRQKLTSGFLKHRSYPRVEQLPAYHVLLNDIGQTELDGPTLKSSKLHIVFDQLLDIPVSDQEEIRFRDRVSAILEEWRSITDSPILDYLERKVQQAQRAAAALAHRQQAERERAEALEQAEAEAAAEFERRRRKTIAPLLPPEILIQICMQDLSYYYAVDDEWDDQNNIQYLNERRTLLACALVARAWSAAANRVLYLGRVHLYSLKSVELFLRSSRENERLPSELRYLRVCGMPGGPGYAKAVRELIPLCSSLYRLEGSKDTLRFSRQMSLPTYPALRALTASDQIFHRLAPLLRCLPALEYLSLSWLTGIDGHEDSRPGAPLPDGLGSRVEALSPPSFSLKTVCLTECRLNATQWMWLLGSSTNIQYAQIQQIDESTSELCRIIGPHVKHLHMKGHPDAPQIGSPDLARSVSSYNALHTLQISGATWPWDELLRDINSALESLHISYSRPGINAVTEALSSIRWQKLLRSVVVHHWADTDDFYSISTADVRRDRAIIEDACKQRQIPLVWLTEGAYIIPC